VALGHPCSGVKSRRPGEITAAPWRHRAERPCWRPAHHLERASEAATGERAASLPVDQALTERGEQVGEPAQQCTEQVPNVHVTSIGLRTALRHGLLIIRLNRDAGRAGYPARHLLQILAVVVSEAGHQEPPLLPPDDRREGGTLDRQPAQTAGRTPPQVRAGSIMIMFQHRKAVLCTHPLWTNARAAIRMFMHWHPRDERPHLPRSAPSPDGASPAVTPYLLLVIRYRVLISGHVQGVYFRDTCRRMALEHRVSGWVRNLPDGRVEAVFEGPAEDVHRLLDWTRRGPHLAVVADVAVQAEHPEGIDTFLIR
jgi:acylphosphatase